MSCNQPAIPFRPTICFTPPADKVKAGRSPFPSEFSSIEAVSNEQRIGQAFAGTRDFYRAITAFRRAEILLRGSDIQRILQLQYEILLSYYLGGKYEETYCYYEQSVLKEAAGPHFPAFRDLMIMVFDSALKTDHCHAATAALNKLEDSALVHKLCLYTDIRAGRLKEAALRKDSPSYLKKMFCCYCKEAKSINKARALNALLPGLGYSYVGQNNTAITAFLVNAVFIGATYQFVKHGLIFPAIISGSLEIGWYVGGIWGAGRAAAEHNERIYEHYGLKVLDQERLYPILNLNYAF